MGLKKGIIVRISVLLIVFIVCVLVLPSPSRAVVSTVSEVNGVEVGAAECLLVRNLKKGDMGADVTALQKMLNLYPDTQVAATGDGSPGKETALFGGLTFKAVQKFQEKYSSEILRPQGFMKPTGYVAVATRAKILQLCSDVATKGNSSTIAKSSGTKPSLSSYISNVYNPETLVAAAQKFTAEAKKKKPSTSTPTPTPTPTTTPSTSTSTAPTSTTPTTTPTTSTTTPVATSTPVTTPTTTTPTIPPTPLPTSFKWGAYTGNSVASIAAFENLVGKPAPIISIFVGFYDGFPWNYQQSVGQAGKTLVIFWETQFGYDKINDGSNDATIRKFAQDAKAYGYPIIFAPFHEMNLPYGGWGYGLNGNTPEKFKLAWKRMYDIFKAEGATNVKFAIDYNQVSVPNIIGNQIADYWPGSGYVDIVALDGFNFGDPWLSTAQLFDRAVSELAGYNKPLYILSIASSDGPQKGTWITDMAAHIKTYPNIQGFVWFNENKERNWLVNSNPTSLSAFKAILPE